MCLPLAFSLVYRDGDAGAFVLAIALCVLVGGVMFLLTRTRQELRVREGFAIVGLGWTTLAAFGAVPGLLAGAFPGYTEAFFETMSGYTTTGASILTDIEALPHGVLFWRSMTHWLGGMGIIVLSLAILPFLGVGGMQLFKAEVPGPVPDKLQPRIKETAKILWGVYLLISALETVLLMAGGMSLFDALCHTFGTVATGGFSTKNASIAHFNSLYIELVIIAFMILAGTNFSLHYRFLTGQFRVFGRDHEFLFYIRFLLAVFALVSLMLFFTRHPHIGQALRVAAFQVVSITTTTGYATADYEAWTGAGQLIMLLLMFIGGCAGSTGGSIKIIRIMIVVKQGGRELIRLLHPSAVLPIRAGGRVIPSEVVTNVLGFFMLYMLVFALGSVIMALLGLDLVTACASVAATLGNIGPGLGTIGPTDNYAHIPATGQWLLSFFMLLGRLELYTILILFVPEFWKK